MIGIMSIRGKLSDKADYLQLDICGLSANEALDRYISYNTNLPIILHGDWTKKDCSENNIRVRKEDYFYIIKLLQEKGVNILGFTIHPPARTKYSFDSFLEICNEIEHLTNVPIFIENRSAKNLWLSSPEEIVSFSNQHSMTIDIPQLYISCGYSKEYFIETLNKINKNNISEYHMGNLIRKEKHTYVARNLEEGEISFQNILALLNPKNTYITLEILGGNSTFEKNKTFIERTLS